MDDFEQYQEQIDKMEDKLSDVKTQFKKYDFKFIDQDKTINFIS